jgi:hypothetical protein
MADEMVIDEREGTPYCTEDKCPNYDGKRCELLGHRPETVCVPYVRMMHGTLREALGLVTMLKAEHDIIRTLCARGELTNGGRVSCREIIQVLDTGEGKQVIG